MVSSFVPKISVKPPKTKKKIDDTKSQKKMRGISLTLATLGSPIRNHKINSTFTYSSEYFDYDLIRLVVVIYSTRAPLKLVNIAFTNRTLKY